MDLYVNIVVCVPRLVLDGDFNAHSAWNSIREFLGVTHYLIGNRCEVYTDHKSLKYIFTQPDLNL